MNPTHYGRVACRNARANECFLATLATLANVPLWKMRQHALLLVEKPNGSRYTTWNRAQRWGWLWPAFRRLTRAYAPWVRPINVFVSRYDAQRVLAGSRRRSVPRTGRAYVAMYNLDKDSAHAAAVVDGVAYDIAIGDDPLPVREWRRAIKDEGYVVVRVHAEPKKVRP